MKEPTMTSRQRLQATLNHQQPDRVVLDFGAGNQTGLAAGVMLRLRQAIFGETAPQIKAYEPYQMLGLMEGDLREALTIDVAGVFGTGTIFGFPCTGEYKPFTMFDGSEVLVPEGFNYTTEPGGGLLMHPMGDRTCTPRGKMPEGAYFFSAVTEHHPIDDAKLDPADNCVEFGPIMDEEVEHFASQAKWLHENTDEGVMITLPGTACGDIALVPATWLDDPPGIRAEDEWYMSLMMRPDYVRAVFEKQLEYALANTAKIIDACKDYVDVAVICGTDFGSQNGLMISPAMFRDLFAPFYKAVNGLIHEKTPWKTFKHCCGSIRELIPDLIDSGFDILNPVQCSAMNMSATELKAEFGRDITFWGGGVDTQKTLPFGTADEVYREVRERIDIFNQDGGFVFSSIHNVLGNTPTDNLLAMFRALHDARGLDWNPKGANQ